MTVKKYFIVAAALTFLAVLGFIAVKLLLLRQQVNRYDTYWQSQRFKDVPENRLIYIAMGDSTAQAIGASSPEKGYVGLLRDRLEEKTEQPVKVINLSKTGAKLDDVLNRQLSEMRVVPDYESAVITLGIGSNNLNTFEGTEFESQIDGIFEQLPRHTIVADLPYFGGGRARNKEPQADQASNIIRKHALKHELKVAELHKITKEQDSLRNYAVDFFHPSDRAYRLWADAFWQQLQTNSTGERQ